MSVYAMLLAAAVAAAAPLAAVAPTTPAAAIALPPASGLAPPTTTGVAPTASATCCHLMKDMVVELEMTEVVSSKEKSPGQLFLMRVALPVKVDGALVIPAGTAAMGEVVDAAPGGMGGRPGKLILAARYIDLGGSRIALHHFHLGESGKDYGGAAMAVAMTFGIPALLISGGNIELPVGTHVTARLARDSDLPPIDSPPASTSPADNTKGPTAK